MKPTTFPVTWTLASKKDRFKVTATTKQLGQLDLMQGDIVGLTCWASNHGKTFKVLVAAEVNRKSGLTVATNGWPRAFKMPTIGRPVTIQVSDLQIFSEKALMAEAKGADYHASQPQPEHSQEGHWEVGNPRHMPPNFNAMAATPHLT